MFKVNNKDTRTTPRSCSSISIVNFEQVNVHWVEKMLENVGQCFIVASTKLSESQYKAFNKIFRIFNYNQFRSFQWLFNGPTRWEKEGVLTFNLAFSTCCILIFLSFFVSFVSNLQRRNLQSYLSLIRITLINHFQSFSWCFWIDCVYMVSL